jgi:glutamate/tyrosine decarboxylase-like PLP-dependent enzyme
VDEASGMQMEQAEKTGDGQPDALDPADWNAFIDACEAQLEHIVRHLSTARDRKAWRPIPDHVKQSIAEDLPLEPQGLRRVCDDIEANIMPYLLGNTHPRFFGWVHGTGTPGGIISAMYSAAINANLGGREHAPVYVERAVVQWFRRLFGFPATSSGLLLSGTSMANVVALAVARNKCSPVDLRQEGLTALPRRMVGYTSAESHVSISKAFELLGLGRDQLRQIPVNEDFTLGIDELRRRIAADRAAGLAPFCVVGTAGTVNTAAIDDLEALAQLCRKEALWFHVDGAFGAMAILSDEHRGLLAGIEKADSLAFDFHKWLHVQYDAACVLIRDGDAHRETFSASEDYLEKSGGAASGTPWFCEYGPELSRGFRALTAWFTFKEHGLTRLGRNITRNCRQAQRLRELVDRHPNLELLAPVSLNIVCFRYRIPAMTGDELDAMNRELVVLVQESGVAVVSHTRINGKLAIRANITNHRTRSADMRILVRALEELAPIALSRVVEPAGQSPESGNQKLSA